MKTDGHGRPGSHGIAMRRCYPTSPATPVGPSVRPGRSTTGIAREADESRPPYGWAGPTIGANARGDLVTANRRSID